MKCKWLFTDAVLLATLWNTWKTDCVHLGRRLSYILSDKSNDRHACSRRRTYNLDVNSGCHGNETLTSDADDDITADRYSALRHGYSVLLLLLLTM